MGNLDRIFTIFIGYLFVIVFVMCAVDSAAFTGETFIPTILAIACVIAGCLLTYNFFAPRREPVSLATTYNFFTPRQVPGNGDTNKASRQANKEALMPQTINKINVLAALRSAAHALKPVEVKTALGYAPRQTTAGAVSSVLLALVSEGLVKRHKDDAQKFFTVKDKRTQIDRMIADARRTPTPVAQARPRTGDIVVPVISEAAKCLLRTIKNHPSALALGRYTSGLSELVSSRLVKQHTRKPGFYFTNPDKRDIVTAILAPATAPVNPQVDDSLSPAESGVLAMLRLSDSGCTLNGVAAAMDSLKTKGFIRTDNRDEHKPAADRRWFTRRSKREQIDAAISDRLTETAEDHEISTDDDGF